MINLEYKICYSVLFYFCPRFHFERSVLFILVFSLFSTFVRYIGQKYIRYTIYTYMGNEKHFSFYLKMNIKQMKKIGKLTKSIGKTLSILDISMLKT